MFPMHNRSLSIDDSRQAQCPRDDDTDSDDSRQASVKRLKDSQVEVEGKTYRVQGKTSVYTIIIAFASMCTLMEDGHIEKLLAGFGNYVNNYTSEILMKRILWQTLVSATLSGMQLHAPQNFALLQFKQLVSLTIRMLALLSQYSSQHVIFHVANSNVDYDPATMTVNDWHNVVYALWLALKSFLTFPLQHEFNILNDKFKGQEASSTRQRETSQST